MPDEDRQADVDRAVQEVEDERHPDQPQDEPRDRAEDGQPRALRFGVRSRFGPRGDGKGDGQGAEDGERGGVDQQRHSRSRPGDQQPTGDRPQDVLPELEARAQQGVRRQALVRPDQLVDGGAPGPGDQRAGERGDGQDDQVGTERQVIGHGKHAHEGEEGASEDRVDDEHRAGRDAPPAKSCNEAQGDAGKEGQRHRRRYRERAVDRPGHLEGQPGNRNHRHAVADR